MAERVRKNTLRVVSAALEPAWMGPESLLQARAADVKKVTCSNWAVAT